MRVPKESQLLEKAKPRAGASPSQPFGAREPRMLGQEEGGWSGAAVSPRSSPYDALGTPRWPIILRSWGSRSG